MKSSSRRFVRALLGAQDVEPLGVLNQHPVHEKTVDAIGVLERLAQAVTRLEVEREGHRTELEVEIDQGDLAPALMGDQPSHAGRHHGRADTTSGTGDRHQFPQPAIGFQPATVLGRVGERLLQQTRRHRLDEIVGDPVGQKIPEHATVIAIAERDHRHARLTDIRQAVDVRQGHVRLAEVDQEQARRAVLAQILDRLLDATLADRGVLQHQLADHLIDHRVGRGIGAEGKKVLTLRIRRPSARRT